MPNIASVYDDGSGSTPLAVEQLEKVNGIVTSKLDVIKDWASRAKEAADTAIEGIGVLTLPTITVNYPKAPELKQAVAPTEGEIPTYTVTNSPVSVAFSQTQDLQLLTPTAIPTPVYAAPVTVPDRPSVSVPEAPTEYPVAPLTDVPDRPDIPVSTAPAVTELEAPNLISMVIPAMPAVEILPFSENIPSLKDAVGEEFSFSDLKDWTEKILADNATAVQDALTAYLAAEEIPAGYVLPRGYNANAIGGENSGVDINYTARRYLARQAAEVEIDERLAAKVKQVNNEWAARNFGVVPGMAIEQINELEIAADKEIRAAAVAAMKESMLRMAEDLPKWQSMVSVLEQCTIDLHLLSIERSLEAEKYKLRSQMTLFNSLLDLYGAKQTAINASIEAYNAELEAVQQKNAANKTSVDGAIAELSENDARVSIYRSQVGLAKTQVDAYTSELKARTLPLEAYKAQIAGVKSNVEIAVANIESYREAIRGYAAAVEAAVSEVGAYAAQVSATASGAGIAEANARLYATHVQEAARANTVYKTFIAEQSDVLNANMQAFRDASQTNEGFVRAQAARVSAEADITAAQINAFDTVVRSYSSYNRAVADTTAAAMSYSLTASENAARAESLLNQANAEAAKVDAGALGAKAVAVSALAQGAMSALNVSASAQGRGGTSSSYGYARNFTVNWGGTTSKSESKIQRLSA